MGKRVPYTLVVSVAARAELGMLRAFDRERIVNAIDANLLYEPLTPSKRRKSLGEPAADFEYEAPLHELKVGEFRVFLSRGRADADGVHLRGAAQAAGKDD